MTAAIEMFPKIRSEYERHRHNSEVIIAARGPVIMKIDDVEVFRFDAYKEMNQVRAWFVAHATATAWFAGEPLPGFIALSEWPAVEAQGTAPVSNAAPADTPVELESKSADFSVQAGDAQDDDEVAPGEPDGSIDGEPSAPEGEVTDEQEAPGEPNIPLIEARRLAKKKCHAVLEEFNSRYAVVNDAGSALIFSDEIDKVLRRQVYRRMTTRALKVLYLNRSVCTRITDDGQRSYKCVADYWLKHENRRQYVGGVTFDPSRAANDPDVLNLWRGFAVEPKRGSWSRLKHHIRVVLCRGDDVLFNYFVGWMARLVQFPAEPGEVAIVLRGDQGTGKGTVGHALLALFRQHGMHISSPKHLIGNFNAHLRDCVLLFADEAFFAGDKASLGVLKAIITERVLTIEAKHVNAIQCPNMLHIIMASNSDWVVPAALDERRFFVLDVSNEHKQDTIYFAAISKELASGGYEAMLYDLQRYDLSAFDIRAVPQTSGLLQQKKYSIETKYSWWRDVLLRGYVYRSQLGLEHHFGRWHEFMATDVLFDSYVEFAKGRDRHPMSREELGRFMREMGGKATRPQSGVVGEHLAPGGAEVIRKVRPHGVDIGALSDARDAFEAVTRLGTEWPEAEDDDS